MEIPTYGGLRKLQEYCKEQGFPLPELVVFDDPDDGRRIDLRNRDLDLTDTVCMGHLFDPRSGNGIVFATDIVVNPMSGSFYVLNGELHGYRAQANSFTTMRPTAHDPFDSRIFFVWFKQNESILENISRWGKKDPSFWDMVVSIICPRAYAKRAFS